MNFQRQLRWETIHFIGEINMRSRTLIAGHSRHPGSGTPGVPRKVKEKPEIIINITVNIIRR